MVAIKAMYTVEEVQTLLRKRAIFMTSQTYLAKRIGVSRSYLSMVILGKRPPSRKILKYLNLKRADVYKELK